MKYIWLDVDPGHDDATAIMLAVNTPGIHLLGVSTTHGNASSNYTALNAARCLYAFGSRSEDVRVYPGADKPLINEAKHDPEIHGVDGLGGVEGLPSLDDARVLAFFEKNDDGKSTRALEGMSRIIGNIWANGTGHKVTIVSSGPMTNIALFVSVYPDLLDAVQEIVFMGGGVGVGNRSAVAEYNILCDPHACQIVLDAHIKKTMIPLNVTHTAIVTEQLHSRLRGTPVPPIISRNSSATTSAVAEAGAQPATPSVPPAPAEDVVSRQNSDVTEVIGQIMKQQFGEGYAIETIATILQQNMEDFAAQGKLTPAQIAQLQLFVDKYGTMPTPAPAATRLRHTISTLISFFAASYKSTFGFDDGPPLHDALTIAYVSTPEIFKTTRYRVDVELSGQHTAGETVVDIWNYKPCDDTWGRRGRNCLVAESVDVPAFFELLFDAIDRCDKISPLNGP